MSQKEAHYASFWLHAHRRPLSGRDLHSCSFWPVQMKTTFDGKKFVGPPKKTKDDAEIAISGLILEHLRQKEPLQSPPSNIRRVVVGKEDRDEEWKGFWVFVDNLPKSLRNRDLKAIFAGMTEIWRSNSVLLGCKFKSAHVATVGGRSRGCGYVEFSSLSDLESALKQFNNTDFTFEKETKKLSLSRTTAAIVVEDEDPDVWQPRFLCLSLSSLFFFHFLCFQLTIFRIFQIHLMMRLRNLKRNLLMQRRL